MKTPCAAPQIPSFQPKSAPGCRHNPPSPALCPRVGIPAEPSEFVWQLPNPGSSKGSTSKGQLVVLGHGAGGLVLTREVLKIKILVLKRANNERNELPVKQWEFFTFF